MKFLELPIFKFAVHVFLLVALGLSIYQYYESWRMEVQIEEEQTQIALIQENLDNLRSPNNYLNSDIYKEKLSRDLNLKKEGEQVIDTSGVEDLEQTPSNYVPPEKISRKSNIEKWWDCFFSPERDACVSD
jgi:hypothetical protein